MKAVLYSRVSTNEQFPANQIAQMREFAAKMGWEITHEYTDVVSGAKGERDRKQFKQMFKAASKRQFDILLFWALDRFTREGSRKTQQYLQQLDDWGIKFRSYTQEYFDTAGIWRDALITIMADMAAQERIAIGERTKAGLERARKEGKRLGRPATTISVETVRDLRQAGAKYRDIAEKLHCSVWLVHKLIHKAEATQ